MAGNWQTTPLVVDGVMYITQRLNDVVALDAATGRAFWVYRYTPAAERVVCCGANNRGLAILGNTLFMGTLDAQLIAIDAKSGRKIWQTEVASTKAGYSITLAPLVVKDKVMVGVGGGEYGIRGFVAAYDANTGKEAWRFYTIPAPGEPGSETWERCPANATSFCDPEAWKHGGGSIWLTGSYDPAAEPHLLGRRQRRPRLQRRAAPGRQPLHRFGGCPRRRYRQAAVALSVHAARRLRLRLRADPVLADNWANTGINVLMWANRNGNFYVLDRATGRFLLGKPFVKVNWMSEFDERGRPTQTPQPEGQPTYPGNQGGTNWYNPSYSPRTRLFYVSAWEDYASIFTGAPSQFKEGTNFVGGGPRNFGPVPNAPGLGRSPINTWTEAAGHGAVLALDSRTGEQKWKFQMTDVTDSGILTTASDLLFAGGREGYFQALDARTGALLWKINLGAAINSGPMSYRIGNKQYVSIVSGLSLSVFALDE